MKTIKTAPTYSMNLDEEGRLIMLTPEELRLSNIGQKIDLTCENHGESPYNWLENNVSSTPIYNMGVTSVDSRLQCDHFTFPRKLDNVKVILTEKGNLPILHSVPCDEYGIASHDWVTFSFDASTLGDEYSSIHPDEVESALTYAIENVLDHHLYEIFGFGLEKKREKGMHNYKYAYELQDMMGMVLYGHSSKKIAVQINGTGCALARLGWNERLYRFLKTFSIKPKLTRVDLAFDDFEGQYISVEMANYWDDHGGFWCGGRQPKIEMFGCWKRPNGKGRSFCIGDRTSGKYCRFYERGKKEGSPLSPWCRAEVEFKGKDRYIPLDILLSPSQYFLGAYPCFEWLAQTLQKEFCSPEKMKTVKKQAQIHWDSAIQLLKDQYGKYIRQFAKIIEPNELVSMLSSSKDEVPKRLKFSHAVVMQSIRLKQPIRSHDEFPLFVGVQGLNDSTYKDFINAVQNTNGRTRCQSF